MSKHSDEATGFCCCAIIAIVLVLGAVSALLDFVSGHPVLSTVIGVVVVLVVGLVVIAYFIDDEKGKTASSGLTGSGSKGASRTVAATRSRAESSRPRFADLDERDAMNREDAVRPRRLEAGEIRGAAIEGAGDSSHVELDAPVPRTDTAEETSSAAVPERPMPSWPGERDGSVNASGADSALARTGVEQEPSRDAGADALTGPELWTREDLQWIIEKSLRRDEWSIFRAGFYSGRGGLDVIAGRGHSRVAVQCHVPERGEPLDETGLRNLLSAPFDVHSIVEVVVVTQSGVLPEARQMATSSTLRIHFIDGTALEAWRHWEASLEPQWGLVSLIK